jgi:hypothetical protein
MINLLRRQGQTWLLGPLVSSYGSGTCFDNTKDTTMASCDGLMVDFDCFFCCYSFQLAR